MLNLDLPPLRPIAPSPGGQLAPDNVVGRDGQITRAWELLEGSSIRLNEPRRIGKTSLLIKMSADPPAGWHCVRQSFQRVTTIDEMAARALGGIFRHQSLAKQIRDNAQHFLAHASAKATVNQVTFELSPAFRDDPVAALEAALHSVDTALGDDRLLLVWDEVPDMVLSVIETEGTERAANLLAVLRRYRDEPARSSVRWLMTGSVGFHHALRRFPNGDALVNDLVNLPLGSLDEQWSRWLCSCLLMGIKVEPGDGTVEEMAQVCGGIPYVAHLVAKQARDRGMSSVSAADVPDLFDEAAADLDQSQLATHFLSRLSTYYGDRTEEAEWILDQIAKQPRDRTELQSAAQQALYALPTDRNVRQILDWLCLDHYLTKDQRSGRYEWRYEPLARIWKIRRA
ncbi:MAG: hypothetical protein ACYCV7_10580 [Acidimicrobiales bacterium]